jgi:ferredoxin
MKVRVNYDLCEGHAKCVIAAPEVFELDDANDQSLVKVDRVPPSLSAKVTRAISLCPRAAITRLDED